MSVNGDWDYNARTTRRSVLDLLAIHGVGWGHLRLEQDVRVPIGSGFGASGASALSGVLAVAKAVGIEEPKTRLAQYPHQAEIEERTGVGTVSVICEGTGAGAIVRPGPPGVASFLKVRTPSSARLVTATIGPFDKKRALDSPKMTSKINELGDDALRRFLADPTLDCLGSCGEEFSLRLGLETVEVKKLAHLAKRAGALHASQNMIGYAVHAVTDEDSQAKVVRAFRGVSRDLLVDVFEVGRRKAGVLSS